MNPDCRDAKHATCSGEGWDEIEDLPMPCPCECHDGPRLRPSVCHG